MEINIIYTEIENAVINRYALWRRALMGMSLLRNTNILALPQFTSAMKPMIAYALRTAIYMALPRLASLGPSTAWDGYDCCIRLQCDTPPADILHAKLFNYCVAKSLQALIEMSDLKGAQRMAAQLSEEADTLLQELAMALAPKE